MYYKKPSPLKPVGITALIFGVLGGYISFQFPTTNSVLGNLAISVTMGGSSAIFGAIVGFIIYLVFKPTSTSLMLREQNELIRNQMKGTKADELNKLAGLRKNGAITEEEFNRLKNEILNRR
ncbi:MAG: hypothetical protein K0Q97_2289 [Bacillota bacterium]|jgi:uncharacterized membrane protein|nr:hypothetical protein [Bacillota bacterium]